MNNKKQAQLNKAMGLFDLILLNIAAIVGLRWTAFAAARGPASLFLWIGALIFFFIPSALAVVELSSNHPDEGGIYAWTKKAFGEFSSFICGFFYWVNNLIYFPNLLMFTAGVFLYVGGSKWLGLEENTLYFTLFSIGVLWFAIILNMIGLKTGKWIQNMGSFGTWITALALMAMGITAYIKFGGAQPFAGNLIPKIGDLGTVSVFSLLCFSFAGMELQGCLGEEIKNPTVNIPRAVFISGVMIALIYILCTAALLVALPADEINVVSGPVQVISKVAEKVNLLWLGPIIALLMTLGSLGGVGAWIAGTARIPFVIGIDNYLPSWFAEIHPKWGTPSNAVLSQGIISTLFIILFSIGSTVKDTYKLLVDATVILYFIPYIFLFLNFIVLKKKKNREKSRFNYPVWLGYLGIISTLTAIVMSFVPEGNTVNPVMNTIKLALGPVLFFLIAVIMYNRAKRKQMMLKTEN